MRWKEKPDPDLGTRRTVVRFALFPIQMKDRTWVWLEFYHRVEAWQYTWVFVRHNAIEGRKRYFPWLCDGQGNRTKPDSAQ